MRGDAALAAKALQTFRRETDKLEFKGGLLGSEAVDTEQILAIARLPARDVLYGQLVGVVASPITGLVRGLNALIAGLALQLGQIAEKKESGEIPAGEPPADMVAAAEARRPRLRPAAEAEAPAAEAEAPGSRGRGPGSRGRGPAPRRLRPRRGGARRDRDRGGPGRGAAGRGRRRDTTTETDNEADASAEAGDRRSETPRSNHGYHHR